SVLATVVVVTVMVTVRPLPTVGAATLTFTVTSTADTHDANPGDGVCADSNGQCTLRAAIEQPAAPPAGGALTRRVPPRTTGLTLGTLQLTANSITISGALSSTTIISGNNRGTVMSIAHTVEATLSQVSLTGGRATYGLGGGLLNAGVARLTNSSVTSNAAND